jgi:hypothetical protein
MRAETDDRPAERHPLARRRRVQPIPARSSDDYIEQGGRDGQRVARKLIQEAREELARLAQIQSE